MKKCNYHTHTLFCDGTDSAADMVEAAIREHMDEIGFSAHGAWPFATKWHLDPTRYTEYRDAIRALAMKYAQTIRIRYGFEADYIPGITAPDSSIYSRFEPDYLIGSVHLLAGDKKNSGVWSVDGPAEEVAEGLADVFANNGKRAVQKYWHTVREMVASCDFDIIGHLDLVRKRNGVLHFFDESDPWYRRELMETVKTIARSGKIVELNTGGMARKALDGIYPSDPLLSMLYRRGVPVTISSDAHRSADLTFAYDTALDAARRAGYREIALLATNPARGKFECYQIC